MTDRLGGSLQSCSGGFDSRSCFLTTESGFPVPAKQRTGATGIRAVRPAHLIWDEGVPGSNPGYPTWEEIKGSRPLRVRRSSPRGDGRACRLTGKAPPPTSRSLVRLKALACRARDRGFESRREDASTPRVPWSSGTDSWFSARRRGFNSLRDYKRRVAPGAQQARQEPAYGWHGRRSPRQDSEALPEESCGSLSSWRAGQCGQAGFESPEAERGRLVRT